MLLASSSARVFQSYAWGWIPVEAGTCTPDICWLPCKKRSAFTCNISELSTDWRWLINYTVEILHLQLKSNRRGAGRCGPFKSTEFLHCAVPLKIKNYSKSASFKKMFRFGYCISVSGSLIVHLHFQGFFSLQSQSWARHLLRHSPIHSTESLQCFLGSSTPGLNKTSRYHTYHSRTLTISCSLQLADYASTDLEEIENQKEHAHSQWAALSAWKILGIGSRVVLSHSTL